VKGHIQPLKLSTIAVALKTDLDIVVDPEESSQMLQTYDVGLAQVDHLGEAGRARMRKVFNWLTRSIFPGPRESSPVVFDPSVVFIPIFRR